MSHGTICTVIFSYHLVGTCTFWCRRIRIINHHSISGNQIFLHDLIVFKKKYSHQLLCSAATTPLFCNNECAVQIVRIFVFHENITFILILLINNILTWIHLSSHQLSICEVPLYKQVCVLVSELNGRSNMSLCESGLSFSNGSELIVSLTVIQVLHFSRTCRFGIVYFLRWHQLDLSSHILFTNYEIQNFSRLLSQKLKDFFELWSFEGWWWYERFTSQFSPIYKP